MSDILSQHPLEKGDADDSDDIIGVEFDNMDDIIYKEDYDDDSFLCMFIACIITDSLL